MCTFELFLTSMADVLTSIALNVLYPPLNPQLRTFTNIRYGIWRFQFEQEIIYSITYYEIENINMNLRTIALMHFDNLRNEAV